jgi:ribonuclease P protein component
LALALAQELDSLGDPGLQQADSGSVLPVIQRLVHKADFERLLGQMAWSRSAHFSVHHVAAPSLVAVWKKNRVPAKELSTELEGLVEKPVDNAAATGVAVLDWALGAVVPKRHAKRAVTRSLLKRQMHASFARHAAQLPAGQWLLRLRQPFSTQQFVSAQSPALRRAARLELDQLFSQPNPQRAPRRSAAAS